MKLLEPPISEEAIPYWDATREQRLVLPWCTDCNSPFWYPRPTCPRCLHDNIEWKPASGAGEVYAVSVQYKPGPMREATDGPYAVALVDLAEGVRMMTNVVGCAPDAVTVGMAVKVHWYALSDGRHLPFFAPA
jgi:uncharacterized OB-fold protein